MQSSAASAINSLCQSIVTVCTAPSVRKKLLLRKLENGLKNTEIKEGSTVTIVNKKMIALQQFFLLRQGLWHSLSFLRLKKNLTVTILIKKLKKVQLRRS